MYYSLHDYKKILKAHKDRLIQTTITLPATNWVGVISNEQLNYVKTHLANNGTTINKFQFIDVLPETGTPNIGYVLRDRCYVYKSSSWSIVYLFDFEAPFTQIVEVNGVTPSNIVFVAPDTDYDNLMTVANCKVIATQQGYNKIMFTAFEDCPELRQPENFEFDENVLNRIKIIALIKGFTINSFNFEDTMLPLPGQTSVGYIRKNTCSVFDGEKYVKIFDANITGDIVYNLLIGGEGRRDGGNIV